jgi:hypothetical protein
MKRVHNPESGGVESQETTGYQLNPPHKLLPQWLCLGWWVWGILVAGLAVALLWLSSESRHSPQGPVAWWTGDKMGHQPLWPMRMVPLGNARIAEIDANPALIGKSVSSEGLSARFCHFSEIGVSVSQTVSGRLNSIDRLEHSTLPDHTQLQKAPTVLMPA